MIIYSLYNSISSCDQNVINDTKTVSLLRRRKETRSDGLTVCAKKRPCWIGNVWSDHRNLHIILDKLKDETLK